MTTFRDLDYDYSGVSLEEGYRIWREHEGRRARIGYGFTRRGKVIPGPHWSGRWVATGGMGNCGLHVMVPVSREARKLVRLHMTECWVNRYGISYREADALFSHRGPYKYELIADICAAIKDDACHEAFRRFPGVGPGAHLDWVWKWGEVVEPYCIHSWPRNAALIAAVCYVVTATTAE